MASMDRTLSVTERTAQEKSLSAAKNGIGYFQTMDIGDLIRQKRKEKRLSQAALADLIEVNKSAVAQWELNSTRPTEDNMRALKRVLDIESGPEPAPGSPYRGKLVEDPDLLAWLDFLEMLPSSERKILAKHIMGNLTSPDKAKSR
jgi:transcriptional regulator with XRE-family HTH domain